MSGPPAGNGLGPHLQPKIYTGTIYLDEEEVGFCRLYIDGLSRKLNQHRALFHLSRGRRFLYAS